MAAGWRKNAPLYISRRVGDDDGDEDGALVPPRPGLSAVPGQEASVSGNDGRKEGSACKGKAIIDAQRAQGLAMEPSKHAAGNGTVG